jgi:multidrug resistance efflux pump
MFPTVAQAILIAVAVGAILFAIHRFAPTSTVAKIEDVVITDAKQLEPSFRGAVSTIEADASALLAKAELWLTDDSAANAKLAKAAALTSEANADKAARQAALRAHIETLQAKLPPAPPTQLPAA